MQPLLNTFIPKNFVFVKDSKSLISHSGQSLSLKKVFESYSRHLPYELLKLFHSDKLLWHEELLKYLDQCGIESYNKIELKYCDFWNFKQVEKYQLMPFLNKKDYSWVFYSAKKRKAMPCDISIYMRCLPRSIRLKDIKSKILEIEVIHDTEKPNGICGKGKLNIIDGANLIKFNS